MCQVVTLSGVPSLFSIQAHQAPSLLALWPSAPSAPPLSISSMFVIFAFRSFNCWELSRLNFRMSNQTWFLHHKMTSFRGLDLGIMWHKTIVFSIQYKPHKKGFCSFQFIFPWESILIHRQLLVFLGKLEHEPWSSEGSGGLTWNRGSQKHTPIVVLFFILQT